MKTLIVALLSVLLIIVLLGAITNGFYQQKLTADYNLAKKAKQKKGDPLPLPPKPPPPPPPVIV
ncbi:MAG: hypothetical protein GXO74_13315 [Calditrichaeota bacterium]|nr:hypothetical protein [Calditrichota bacterium]